jgi:holo-[acyl-carrier protein] synthase
MTLRVGTDLTVVSRVERLIATVGEPFLARTWTSAERAACADRAESLAARWAAKEATLKALGAGVDEIAMTDVAVGESPAGPVLELSGAAADRAAELGLTQWALSLSHDGGLALAVVVATGGD